MGKKYKTFSSFNAHFKNQAKEFVHFAFGVFKMNAYLYGMDEI